MVDNSDTSSDVIVSDGESIVEVNDAEAELVLTKNTKSLVWKYFGFEVNDDGRPTSLDTPKCRLCQLPVGAKDSNTTNLYSHLKIKHPEEFSLLQCTNSSKRCKAQKETGKNQPSLTETWNKHKLLSSDSREHKELTTSVACCLARDMLPLSTVDKPGFRTMLQKFNPRYQLPTCKHFTKVAIPRLVLEVRSNIECQIASRELEYFSATTDLWTSASGDPYITLTCHFIDHSWELKSLCLQTHYIPEDHTAENISEVLAGTLQQWKLEDNRLVGITTDSGSNIKLACELVQWNRLSCFGHNLNLAVGKGLKDSRVQRALKVCRSAVAAFSRSWKKQRDLMIAQEQKQLPVHRLKLDVVTRWGSAYDMVERILEQMEAIRIVLGGDRNSSHLIPTWQDSDVLQSVAAALKPLKVMTDALSGEKCITISAVKPLLNHLINEVLVEKEEDTELTKEIKEKIRVDIELRYTDADFEHLLELSSFLDPRFKLVYVKNRAKVLEEVEKQMLESITNNQISETTSSNDAAIHSEPQPPPTKKAKGLSKILGQCLGNSSSAALSAEQKVKQELDQYLSHPHLDVEESPMEWWKTESTRYPHVAQLARKYLSLCATSVPSERVFSCRGNIVSDKRTCLKPDRVDSLVFLALNMKN